MELAVYRDIDEQHEILDQLNKPLKSIIFFIWIYD